MISTILQLDFVQGTRVSYGLQPQRYVIISVHIVLAGCNVYYFGDCNLLQMLLSKGVVERNLLECF